jgi:hypothetical protein
LSPSHSPSFDHGGHSLLLSAEQDELLAPRDTGLDKVALLKQREPGAVGVDQTDRRGRLTMTPAPLPRPDFNIHRDIL